MPGPPIETGSLASGHPFARIGDGSRQVLYIPGLSFDAAPSTPKAIARSWGSWLDAIAEHDLTIVTIGRRADLAPGSTGADVADDYAAVIRERWGSAVGVMGISTGGAYAQWLAIRHPDLVERLVLGFTAHRNDPAAMARQNALVEHLLAGRWRAGYAQFGPWFLPRFPRVGSAIAWLVGPHLIGRYADLRVLRIDAHADDIHDTTEHLAQIHCPTLVVSGGRDLAYPRPLVADLVAGLPNVRHVEFPKAGHMGPGKPFATVACAFLGEGDPRDLAGTG
jgi:pimeloyl-ACP methyl ester carboxylesterase